MYSLDEQKSIAEELGTILGKWSFLKNATLLNFPNKDINRKAAELAAASVLKVKLQQFFAEELDVVMAFSEEEDAAEDTAGE